MTDRIKRPVCKSTDVEHNCTFARKGLSGQFDWHQVPASLPFIQILTLCGNTLQQRKNSHCHNKQRKRNMKSQDSRFGECKYSRVSLKKFKRKNIKLLFASGFVKKELNKMAEHWRPNQRTDFMNKKIHQFKMMKIRNYYGRHFYVLWQ